MCVREHRNFESWNFMFYGRNVDAERVAAVGGRLSLHVFGLLCLWQKGSCLV